MDQLKTKGQTALEYLLIVVVAIIVVVAVMMYMNSSTTAGTKQGVENQLRVTCAAQSCNTVTECEYSSSCKHFCNSKTPASPCTGSAMRVECVGAQSIVDEPVPGHCSVNLNATYRAF